jgi:hypothetical protein
METPLIGISKSIERIRNRMYGGEGGRRARALLLPDLALRFLKKTSIRTIKRCGLFF